MKIKLRYISFFLFSSIGFFSCENDPDCNLEQPENILKIVFYEENEEEEMDSIQVKYDLVQVSGSDSILYNRSDTLALFNLPVNPEVDTLSYFFITGVSRDSITIRYQRKLDWLSESCGPYFKFNDLKIITHSFDSINIPDPSIDKTVNENIQIYNF